MAVASSRWFPYSTLPVVGPDGTVCEPVSGRFDAAVRPEDGEAGLRAAVASCPDGGTLLLRPGEHALTSPLELPRSLHVFGRGAAVLVGSLPRNTELVDCCADGAITLDQVKVDNRSPAGCFTLVVCVKSLDIEVYE